jgi:hypothetical protein
MDIFMIEPLEEFAHTDEREQEQIALADRIGESSNTGAATSERKEESLNGDKASKYGQRHLHSKVMV